MPMAKGPKGERRPADVNARAVVIGKIAAGEISDVRSTPESRGQEFPPLSSWVAWAGRRGLKVYQRNGAAKSLSGRLKVGGKLADPLTNVTFRALIRENKKLREAILWLPLSMPTGDRLIGVFPNTSIPRGISGSKLLKHASPLGEAALRTTLGPPLDFTLGMLAFVGCERDFWERGLGERRRGWN